MNHLTHCTRCQSRSVFSTDGNGRLVERRNHDCQCPPLSLEPEALPGGQPGPRRKGPRRAHKQNRCVDCGEPISGYAKRCPPHAAERHKRAARDYERRKRVQRARAA